MGGEALARAGRPTESAGLTSTWSAGSQLPPNPSASEFFGGVLHSFPTLSSAPALAPHGPPRRAGSSSPLASPRPSVPSPRAPHRQLPGGPRRGARLPPAGPPPGPGWDAGGVSRGWEPPGHWRAEVASLRRQRARSVGLAPCTRAHPGRPLRSAPPRPAASCGCRPGARPRGVRGAARRERPARGARRRARGLLLGGPGAALPKPALPGRAWGAPSLSPAPGPPGLVVLNISQLRYRTVELLRTTGPSARSSSAALCGEEPRRPGARPRATTCRAGAAAGPSPPPARGRRAPRAQPSRRRAPSTKPGGASVWRRPAPRRLLSGAAALPRRRNAFAPRRPDRFFRAGRLLGPQVARLAVCGAGPCSARPRGGGPDSPASRPRPAPPPPGLAPPALLGPALRPGRWGAAVDHSGTVLPGPRGARLTAGRVERPWPERAPR